MTTLPYLRPHSYRSRASRGAPRLPPGEGPAARGVTARGAGKGGPASSAHQSPALLLARPPSAGERKGRGKGRRGPAFSLATNQPPQRTRGAERATYRGRAASLAASAPRQQHGGERRTPTLCQAGRAGVEGGRERGEGRGPGGGRATSCCSRPPPRGLTRPAEFTFPASSPAGAGREFSPLLAGEEGEGARTTTCRAGEERGEGRPPPLPSVPTCAVAQATRVRALPLPHFVSGCGPPGWRCLCRLPLPSAAGCRGVPRRGSHAVPNQCTHDAGGDLGVIREQHFRLMNGSSQLSALMKVSACS